MKIAVAAKKKEVEGLTDYLAHKYRILYRDDMILEGTHTSVLTVKDEITGQYIALESLIKKTYGVNISIPGKSPSRSIYRRTAAYILVKRFGWSMTKAAEQLNYRNHAAISVGIRIIGDIDVVNCSLLEAVERCLGSQNRIQ